MILHVVARNAQGVLRPDQHLIDLGQQAVAGGDIEVAVDAAGNRSGAVDLFAGRRLDDLLPELAHQDGAQAKFGVLSDHLKDIAPFCRSAKAEQQVGGREVKEMQDMALHHLPVMHQAAHLLGGGGQGIDADDLIHRLGGRQMVTDRTNAAQPLHDDRHFPQQPPPDETFKAAKLDDMQPRLIDLIVLVKVDCHLAMPFDAGDGRDFDQSGLSHIAASLSRTAGFRARTL